MSVVRGFGLNGKSFYTNVVTPRQVNLQFTVNSSDTGGLGITGLKSNGYVENVFMHTSATAGSNNGFTNPNPANGFCLVQVKQNFNVFLGASAIFTTPTATSTKVDNSALTVGQVYVISTLGNSTAAQWATLGVPVGVTPAVGVVFTALLIGIAGEANTSTSRVMLPTTSGIGLIEVVGVTNTMVNTNSTVNSGQWVTFQFSKSIVTMNSYTPAGTNNGASPPIFSGTPATLTGTNTYTPAAPANASVCNMSLYFDGSTVTIDGL